MAHEQQPSNNTADARDGVGAEERAEAAPGPRGAGEVRSPKPPFPAVLDGHGPYTLQTTDWNAEWKAAHAWRASASDAAYWDKRSATFDSADVPSDYVRALLRLCAIRPGERVLDMGCGTGSIAIPLAREGHPVLACDFSQGMLAKATERADRLLGDGARGLVETRQAAWEDDWPAAGIGAGSVDVAVASRSIATDDMAMVFSKMSKAARRRCCVTLPTSASPRITPSILHAIGIRQERGRAHQYAWNVLANMGLEPECAFIRSDRHDTFDGPEEAWGTFSRMLDAAVPEADEAERASYDERMRGWIRDNLVPNEHAGEPDDKGMPQKRLRLRRPREFTWAFLAWDV